MATGGASGGGTIGTGGTIGIGGSGAVCQNNATQCVESSIETCVDGQWNAPGACPARQTCTTPAGQSARCSCVADPVCSAVGGVCASTSVQANCMQDAMGCLYEGSSMTCNNGACSGTPGSAQCCSNACTPGKVCASSTALQVCATGSNGCTAATVMACGTGLVCERLGTASCADPNWAEWPMPNGASDVNRGAPTMNSYTDHGNGTITDNVTGLLWQQSISPNRYTFAAATAYCTSLSLAGHADWRVSS